MRTVGTSGAAVPRPDPAGDPPPGELPAVVTNEREPDEPDAERRDDNRADQVSDDLKAAHLRHGRRLGGSALRLARGS